jgi:tetraacyldisaccharide 4'-kinase
VQRADIVIHTRCPKGATVAATIDNKPAFASYHRLIDAIPLSGGTPLPLSALVGIKTVAFAGIAQPEGFFSGLLDSGINVVQSLPFPDHAIYDHDRIEELRTTLQNSEAAFAITTEKDAVKLRQLPTELADKIYVVRLGIDLEKPAHLLRLIHNLLQKC